MKIILFLNNDIHSLTALKRLYPSLKNHDLKIITSQEVGNANNLHHALQKMKLHEKVDISQAFNIKTHSYSNINADSTIEDLKQFSPDLGISIRYGQILQQDVIDLFPSSILNLHSGILPDYKGVIASFWAILHGQTHIGMTLHYITNPGIDTGNIIGTTTNKVHFDQSLFDNINGLYEEGSQLIINTLDKIQNHQEIKTIDQKTLHPGNYFSYPTKHDVDRFLEIMPLI